MNKNVVVPLGDGTNRLHKLQQAYIRIASELLEILNSSGTLGKGTFTFAQHFLFHNLPDGVTDISMSVALSLTHALALFDIPDVRADAGKFRPHDAAPFASVKLYNAHCTVELWLCKHAPYAVVQRTKERNSIGTAKEPQLELKPKQAKKAAPKPTVNSREFFSQLLKTTEFK